MVYVYDLEIFKNFFSTTAKSVDSGEVIQLYIHQDHNDLEKIYNLYVNSDDWWVGYNSTAYDDPLIQYILDKYDVLSQLSADEVTANIYVKSSEIIEDKYAKYQDVSFKRFDLMEVAGLFKSLKLVGVNLKHDLIQDLPYKHNQRIQIDQVNEVLQYNLNDVEITQKLYEDQREEILLRQQVTSIYGINLMNESRSAIANRILERDYGRISRQRYWDFKDINTERYTVDFGKIISDKISFKTKNLQDLLKRIKSTVAKKGEKIEFNVRVGSTRYDILKGGIHSNMPAEIYESSKDTIITDADVSSYYPFLMIYLKAIPEHLHQDFINLVEDYTMTRIDAKKDGDNVAADVLKRVINSIYGKMGNEHHWLYDPKAMYQVTLNGQLFLLMLVERLELAGIPVFYANTDGITAKVPYTKKDEYRKICQKWQKYTGFSLDFDEYEKCIILNVNNYIWIPKDKEKDVKYKGFFDINRWKDVTKSFDKPIVPLAISKYFIDGISPEKTIQEHKDILDFCMAQKVGSKFETFHEHNDNGTLVTDKLQDTNRYYIGKGGGRMYKKEPGTTKEISLAAGDPVWILNDVSHRNAHHYPIKYRYYIREVYKVINEFNFKQTDLFL